MTLSGSALLAGVMGWPIEHSRSPRLHGFWLERHGIDGAYLPFAVAPDKLAEAFRALPVLGLRGVNLTIPHKETALALCDDVTDQAARIGAVNTIVVGADGTLTGSNTDAFGFIENIQQDSDWQAAAGPAVMIGAGGAARAVAVALIDAGVPELRIANRTIARAEALAGDLSAPATAITVHDWPDRAAALDGAALLVNTTSLGMHGQPPLDLDLDALPADAVVNDIVYVPLETPLLQAAAARGNPVVDGLGMLLHQARPGFEQWFGVRPAVDDDLRRFVLADID